MAESDASSKQHVTSLLTEHLRYTPITLIDDIINTVNELVFRAVGAVEQGLTGAAPQDLGFAKRAEEEGRVVEQDEDGNNLYPEARLEIEDGVHQLETLLEAMVDKTFDKLEIYVLRNILTVPKEVTPYIKLGHYEGLDFSSSASSEQDREALFALRRKLQETRRLHNALLAEQSRNTAILNQLVKITGASFDSTQGPSHDTGTSLSFLTTSPAAKELGVGQAAAGQQEALTSHTAFTVSQLPALRQMYEMLKARLESIPRAPLLQDEEERHDYIETQTRRQFERSGIDVESGEGLIGQVAAAQTKKVTREDVQAVESLANKLAGDQPTSYADRGVSDEMEQ